MPVAYDGSFAASGADSSAGRRRGNKEMEYVALADTPWRSLESVGGTLESTEYDVLRLDDSKSH